MSITEEGCEGERIAREILKRHGFSSLFGADWVVKSSKGEYFVVEVKYKSEPFKKPPFDGHGTELRQIIAREQFRKDTGIKSILLIIEKSGRVLWNFIDVLEKGESFTTRNQIRIYPLTNYLSEEKLEELHNGY